ncbi:MAG: RluA family pseudouridine synthase [Candidatus Onthomonas sp.]
MREFTIGKNDAGQRLDRWMGKTMPLLPAPLAQKYIRIKRVKLNGKGAKRDTRLQVGDVLQLYINDEFFEQPTEENAFLSLFQPRLDILYEDQHLLLVNKPAGMVVHADETEKVNTLINHIQAYLYQKREWSPRMEHAFTPALCNRIDRNTCGIVIAAKTAEALRVMNQKIRDRELEKRYLCVGVGSLQPREGTLEGFLLKDEAKKQVTVYHHPVPNGRSAATRYRTLARKDGLSLIECELLTGRTHQIRAQLAEAGCPLLGDGKYGSEKINRRYGRRQQALCSWSLTFRFTTDAGELAYLNGRTWRVPSVDFLDAYFPEFRLTDLE